MPTPERRQVAADTSQCGVAMADDGSSSWTPAIPSQQFQFASRNTLHRRKQKNPVPFRVRGWLLVAHPSYKLDQQHSFSRAGKVDNAGPQLLRLTVRRNGLKDSFWVSERLGLSRKAPVGLAVSTLTGRNQGQVTGGRKKVLYCRAGQRRHCLPIERQPGRSAPWFFLDEPRRT